MSQNNANDPTTIDVKLSTIYLKEIKLNWFGSEGCNIGDALGLRSFGDNSVTLGPGIASLQRYLHSNSDDFYYMCQGEETLVDETVEQVLGPGMAADCPANKCDGHHLPNETDLEIFYLEVDDRSPKNDADNSYHDMPPRDVKFVQKVIRL